MTNPSFEPARQPQKLRDFVSAVATLLTRCTDTRAIVDEGALLLRDLIASDDWLPDRYARPQRLRYGQYLLHADAAGRFSVVSFVWGPGQSTPIHDHTVWGLIGMLRGAEISQAYGYGPDGTFGPQGAARRLEPGNVELVYPPAHDVHGVANAYDDRVSISIHVYGADIGSVPRFTYHADGTRKPFISAYSDMC